MKMTNQELKLEFEFRLNSINEEYYFSKINRVRNFVNDLDNWKFIEEMEDDEITQMAMKLSEKLGLDNKITELVIRNEIYLIHAINEIIDENYSSYTIEF